MIGAVIFVIFFVAGLAISLGMPTLPPGNMIHSILNIPETTYPVLGIPAWILITSITNGVVYGFVIWLIFSVVSMATGRREKVYTCGVCNLTFGTKDELVSHAKTHEKAKQETS